MPMSSIWSASVLKKAPDQKAVTFFGTSPNQADRHQRCPTSDKKPRSWNRKII
jgi:hypothetical protein